MKHSNFLDNNLLFVDLQTCDHIAEKLVTDKQQVFVKSQRLL